MRGRHILLPNQEEIAGLSCRQSINSRNLLRLLFGCRENAILQVRVGTLVWISAAEGVGANSVSLAIEGPTIGRVVLQVSELFLQSVC